MKCKYQGCNKEFKNEHNMKIHYHQMHIWTQDQRNEKATKIKYTKANRTEEEEKDRIKKMKETVDSKTPEEKAIINERKSKGMKKSIAKKTPEEKKAISRKMKEVKSNKTPEEKAEIVRKIQITRNNRTPEQKALDLKRKQDAWKRKTQKEKEEFIKKVQKTKANWTPEQRAQALANMKKAWKNMSLEKKQARYLKTLSTWKKNGKCKFFMGEWYQSILEVNIAKLLWKNLGCIFITGFNREISMNGGRIDFYPRILGCLIELHPMDSPYEQLSLSQRDEYKKRRIAIKNENGYEDIELIHYVSYKEAKESIKWISNKIKDYSPKNLLHSIDDEHEKHH
jgi:hypothetical protein